ncbi:hypothetical protein Tco_0763738 [Tanacetum coccineum]
MPQECLRIIESKSKVRNSRNKPVVAKVVTSTSTSSISPEVTALTTNVAELKDMMKTLILDKQKSQAPATVMAVEEKYVTCGGAHSYQNCPATDGNVYRDNIQEYVNQPLAYQAPAYQAPAPQTQGVTKTDFESYVKANDAWNVKPSASMPNLKPTIPYPSRRNDERRREKANDQIEKFYEIFKDLSFEISLTDALILMSKFASTLKALIGNKEKLSEMARNPLNEHCSAVILNKLPEKLRDPGKFLIPCDFPGTDK